MYQIEIETTPKSYSDSMSWELEPIEMKKRAIRYACQYLDIDDADCITMQNNLELFTAFISLAFHRKRVGKFEIYGGRAIMEHLRWHTNKHDNSRMYKISNDITPRFCAVSMELFPQLNGFFRKQGCV